MRFEILIEEDPENFFNTEEWYGVSIHELKQMHQELKDAGIEVPDDFDDYLAEEMKSGKIVKVRGTVHSKKRSKH